VRIRQITAPDDPGIAAFGAIQERSYGDPEMLIPPEVFPRLLARQSGERRNLMLVAEDDAGQVIGGTLFHYLGAANCGFSSFLAVAPEVRGQGVARRLHAARFALLDDAAGERAPVPGLFIDVVAPERLTPAEVERERAVGIDPVDRRRIFQRMGFRKVDVAYFQPGEGSYGGEPVTTMDLLFCPRDPAADWVERDLVVETMRAYWKDWLGKAAADRDAAELARRCGGERVGLLPAYEG
jgi:GNAT superfamily N-acetyltransferase